MRSGLFLWYSDQPVDAMNVHNVSAMLGGVYGMAAGILRNEEFREIAGRALGELMSHAKQEEDGHLGWVYMDAGKTRPNDLVHACYIVYGAMLADQALETPRLPKAQLLAYLSGFLDEKGLVLEFRPDEAGPRSVGVRARAWGLGMLVFVLAELGDGELARKLMGQAEDYRLADGDFPYDFGGQQAVPRATAHLALGAARIG